MIKSAASRTLSTALPMGDPATRVRDHFSVVFIVSDGQDLGGVDSSRRGEPLEGRPFAGLDGCDFKDVARVTFVVEEVRTNLSSQLSRNSEFKLLQAFGVRHAAQQADALGREILQRLDDACGLCGWLQRKRSGMCAPEKRAH